MRKRQAEKIAMKGKWVVPSDFSYDKEVFKFTRQYRPPLKWANNRHVKKALLKIWGKQFIYVAQLR